MHGDLDFAPGLGRDVAQGRLVAVGQREVTAPRGKLAPSARPMPLAAPVTAAAAPRIAVIVSHSMLGRRGQPYTAAI